MCGFIAFLSQKKLEIAESEKKIINIEELANLRAVSNVRDKGVAPELDQPLSTQEIETRFIEAASINGFRDQIKQAENYVRNLLLDEVQTLEKQDPESEDLQNLKLLIENKWFARKWGDEEKSALAAEKGDGMGATALKVIPAEKYVGDSGNYRGVSEATGLQTVKTNFPLFQSVRGDGICGLHSGIIASLTKCVGDRYYFDQFKNKGLD